MLSEVRVKVTWPPWVLLSSTVSSVPAVLRSCMGSAHRDDTDAKAHSAVRIKVGIFFIVCLFEDFLDF